MNCPQCQTPLAEGAQFCSACGATSANRSASGAPGPAAVRPVKQGWAIASLVFSLLCVTGPLGLILGIVALVKAGRHPQEYGGKVVAILGIIFGFLSLPVLLLMLIPIFGITSAIAIPNFLSAVERGKQKRTMGDMKTLAAAIEQYNTDANSYPLGNSIDEVCKTLINGSYLTTCLRNDGWGQPFHYRAWGNDNNRPDMMTDYAIVSAGKDGIFQMDDPRDYQQGDIHSFNSDIVISDGQFVRSPNGKQHSGPPD